MNVLLGNKFHFEKGGAEKSMFETARLLREKGHGVRFFAMAHPRNLPSDDSRFFVSEVDYDDRRLPMRLKSAGRMLYSFEARSKLGRLLDAGSVDVAHLNNIYHQLSPSILTTLRKRGVPIVMSLRDYKVVCGSYQMLTAAGICEACKGGRHWHAAQKRCAKNSGAMSFLTTVEMYLHHQILHLYEQVDVFIAPSRFLKDKVAEMGFPGRVVHIPNFADVARIRPRPGAATPAFVYFGRLGPEKGIGTLVEAMRGVPAELTVIGEGPVREALEAKARDTGIANVKFAGYMSGQALEDAVASSLAVVIPSEWYENNPRAVIEAFALGKPVVGSRIGGIPELVRQGQTGLTYTMGSVEELRACLLTLLAAPESAVAMGRRGRTMVETELSPERHYEALMGVYEEAMAAVKVRAL